MLMKLRTYFKNQKGFTLIELLVVISIIGILAAVAVPKFMDSTAVARTAKVQADLAAMDSAIQLFAADHAGALPDTTTILPYLSSGALPVASVGGKYRIGGAPTTANVTAVVYSVNENGRAVATFTPANGGPFTAETLGQ